MSFVASSVGIVAGLTLFAFLVFLTLAAWAVENRRRRRHSVPAGLQAEVDLPFEETFELYHSALSLCPMKSRLCLAELQIPYKSHHIDLIETGGYENIRAPFVRMNPGGTVPVLVHEGHPIYESHEQVRYAAKFGGPGVDSLVPEDPELRAEMEAWVNRSSLTGDPTNQAEVSAGNAVPGQTVPLLATMIEKILYWTIFEGLLFHFDKFRPVLFTVLKIRGIERIDQLAPAAKAIAKSRDQMGVHLDAFEKRLKASGAPGCSVRGTVSRM